MDLFSGAICFLLGIVNAVLAVMNIIIFISTGSIVTFIALIFNIVAAIVCFIVADIV